MSLVQTLCFLTGAATASLIAIAVAAIGLLACHFKCSSDCGPIARPRSRQLSLLAERFERALDIER
jgi:hypothetical protein